MILKRIYHQDKLTRDADGKVVDVAPGAVLGVIVKRADKGVQHISPNFVDGGVQEGWLSMGHGKLTVHNLDGDDLVYAILRVPGHYCCHCETEIVDANVFVAEGVTAGSQHVAEAHAGVPSPDPNNPSGFRRENFYTCMNQSTIADTEPLEAAQLEKQIRRALHEKLAPKYQRRAHG